MAFVGHGAERTGPPVFLLRLLRWLRDHAQIEAEALLNRGGALLADYRSVVPTRVVELSRTSPAGLAERAITAKGWTTASARLRQLRLQRRLGRFGPADVIYLNAAAPANMDILAVLPTEVPVLTHIHELETGLSHNLSSAQHDRLLSRTSRFLAVSEAARANLVDRHGVDPSLISHAPGFVEDVPPAVTPREARRRLGLEDVGPLIGSAGVTDWRKAPDLFLRLAWEVRRLRPGLPTRWAWLGGKLDWPLAHERAHLGLVDEVDFVGELEEPLGWFAALDVLVLTAREDAFPLVCVEAAAAGRPIVCFDTGGTAELVEASGGGVVIPYPRVDEMAQRVAELTDAPEVAAAMGDRGRRHVSAHHTADAVCPSILDAVLRTGRARPDAVPRR